MFIANGQSTGEVMSMTESQREEIVEGMFPDWREHLNDGKVIDHILEGLSCRKIVLNRCSRPSCYNVARPGLKRCTRCAAQTAQYMRSYERRKTANRERVDTCREQESISGQHRPNNNSKLVI
jgi:hypothetical protein